MEKDDDPEEEGIMKKTSRGLCNYKTPSADPHARCCGGWGRKTPGTRLGCYMIYMNCFCMQFQAECSHNLKYCFERWTAFSREGLVETFSG